MGDGTFMTSDAGQAMLGSVKARMAAITGLRIGNVPKTCTAAPAPDA